MGWHVKLQSYLVDFEASPGTKAVFRAGVWCSGSETQYRTADRRKLPAPPQITVDAGHITFPRSLRNLLPVFVDRRHQTENGRSFFAHRRHQSGCAEQVAILNDLRAPSAKRIAASGGVKMNSKRLRALIAPNRQRQQDREQTGRKKQSTYLAPLMQNGLHHCQLTTRRDLTIPPGEAVCPMIRT